jgi:hypothetical protein
MTRRRTAQVLEAAGALAIIGGLLSFSVALAIAAAGGMLLAIALVVERGGVE